MHLFDGQCFSTRSIALVILLQLLIQLGIVGIDCGVNLRPQVIKTIDQLLPALLGMLLLRIESNKSVIHFRFFICLVESSQLLIH